jgi:hypothetical protein
VVHNADGIVEADVLEEERNLVDALKITKACEPEASEFLAAEDDSAGGGTAESHLWEEGVD